MNLSGIAQTIYAIAAISLILIGSARLKKHLKRIAF